MSVRSILIAFNRVFLIFGLGSINYERSNNFQIKVMFNVLRYSILLVGLLTIYKANLWVNDIFKIIEIV